MALKLCPQCQRYSVSFDFGRGLEVCRWTDCGWVNAGRQDLPVAHATLLSSRTSQRTEGPAAARKEGAG